MWRMLFAKPGSQSWISKEVLSDRLSMLEAGQFQQLLASARACAVQSSGNRRQQAEEEEEQTREERCLAKVKQGALTKARQALAGSTLAAGTQETLD
eukprot:7536530-Karenia_brevis.AAC.1